ncbi:siroheme synthase [Sporolactobacillus shoreae]|uniref:precorrin-2 dehydrogenase n=1 Tax=Sporolactobacillus shoreae TaxID=1465501 RepID=A0A4Z0GUF2_9BACL|nr:NAD(P)-dependent oxidoreductase [Sporolactobacillus shoreae]TGA99932.1 siroheme synthase [Sporolactobacillus shoreae]
MPDYPLILNLEGKSAVVAGGGSVATRKIRSLVSCGARVTVICEKASNQVQEWVEKGAVIWKKRDWINTDAEGVFLIIAATDDETVNAAIAESARPNQLVCVAGNASLGNFSVPAVARRGRLTLTVSTGGASPFYAKKLRDDLSNGLKDDLEEYLDFLSLFRQQILEKHLDRGLRKKCLKNVLQPEFHNKMEQLKLLEGLDQWIQNQRDLD